MVRRNNENTLHQGWDIDSRWNEVSAGNIPMYNTKNKIENQD